jgi:hypothetical protein
MGRTSQPYQQMLPFAGCRALHKLRSIAWYSSQSKLQIRRGAASQNDVELLLGMGHSLNPSEQRGIAFAVVLISVFVFASARLPQHHQLFHSLCEHNLKAGRLIGLPSLPPLLLELTSLLDSLRMLIETNGGLLENHSSQLADRSGIG